MLYHQLPEVLRRSFESDKPLAPPRLAMLNIVPRCNAGCVYCSDWRNDKDPRHDPRSDLLRGMIDDLAELGVDTVMFTGGEPFLRRDLLELMVHARSLGLDTATITNGTVMTPRLAERLVAIRPVLVGVSIDSLSARTMQAVRGLPVDRVLRTVDLLLATFREAGRDAPLALETTVTSANADDLVPLARFAAERGIAISYQPVAFSGSGADGEVLQRLWPDELAIERVESAVRELLALQAAGVRILNRPEFLAQIPQYFRRRTFYPEPACTVAYTDIVVDTELGVRPCWPMAPVGTIDATTSLKDVWSGDRMRAARATIRERRCPGCLYSCHLDKPITLLPQ